MTKLASAVVLHREQRSMLALAFAFFGYMGDKRVLVGINNAMPMTDTGDTGSRGYVILGPHADWSSAPV